MSGAVVVLVFAAVALPAMYSWNVRDGNGWWTPPRRGEERGNYYARRQREARRRATTDTARPGEEG